MPTRNVNLTDELDHFVMAKVESGRYENASEVVRAALRTLEREEQEYEAKLAALKTAIDEGDSAALPRETPLRVSAGHLNFPEGSARGCLDSGYLWARGREGTRTCWANRSLERPGRS